MTQLQELIRVANICSLRYNNHKGGYDLADITTNIRLCAYYFTSESFNRGDKIIDSFIPLIEAVMRSYPEKRVFSFVDLKSTINNMFEVNMPSATLDNLLSIMKSKGIISVDKHKHVSRMKLDGDYWCRRDNIEAEIAALFSAFRDFLNNKGIDISQNEAKDIVCNYIFTYSFELSDFVSGLIDKVDLNDNEREVTYLEHLCEFLFLEKERNSSHYQAFVKLYEGAIQTSLLNFLPNQIADTKIEEFCVTDVILDTNFLMRILDIQTEIECRSALETLDLLKSLKVNLIVLEQTVQEVGTSIKSFLEDSDGYLPYTRKYLSKQHIRSTGLLDAIMRGATSKTELLELSSYEKLKEEIQHKKIKVIEGEYFQIPDIEIQSLVAFKNRCSYTDVLAKHDLSLISYCREHRDKHADTLDSAKWWVLTNDFKLTYWNQKNKMYALHECITEAQMSNLLWLSKQKTYNNGLSNTMVTLANNHLLSPSELGSFAIKMHKINEQSKGDSKALDKLSIVYASDCITDCDVRRVNADEQDLMDYVDEKAQQITKESKRREEEYNATIESMKQENQEKGRQVDDLKEKFKKIGIIDTELEKISNEMENIHEQEVGIDKQITQICSRQKELQAVVTSAGRIVIAIFSSCFVLYIGIIIAVITVITKYVSKNIQAIVLPIAFGIVGTIIIYFVPGIVTGKLMKPAETFEYLKNELIKKRVQKFADSENIKIEKPLAVELPLLAQQLKHLSENRETLLQKLSEKKEIESQKVEERAELMREISN